MEAKPDSNVEAFLAAQEALHVSYQGLSRIERKEMSRSPGGHIVPEILDTEQSDKGGLERRSPYGQSESDEAAVPIPDNVVPDITDLAKHLSEELHSDETVDDVEASG